VDTDVLIVGAGPTGLMLANQLARRRVRCAIVDRHAGPALQTRALGVQARTLEIYAKLGVADRALELGKRGTGANLWEEGRPRPSFYLLRPDGHVGLCGSIYDAAACERYFEDRLQVGGQA
jgi:2-polyprenyl-6-methoxyphenol hydroxylase-like FAD-dependent oxidoreductase